MERTVPEKHEGKPNFGAKIALESPQGVFFSIKIKTNPQIIFI